MNEVSFGNNKFCGPSVMSAILGITTDEAAAVISSITGRKKVAGVYLSDLKKAFESCGCMTADIEVRATTVFGNLFNIKTEGYYVFMVPGHFIAIEINGSHRYICDNHSRSPINAGSSARLGQKTTHIIRVLKP